MHSIIIFASGTGTNTAAIIDYFRSSKMAEVRLVVCNKAEAGVLEIAKNEGIPFLIISKATIDSPLIIGQMQQYQPSLVVLAGFLWKIPDTILNAFTGKVINIHPSLLPAYGGLGMYGSKVHQAVINGGEMQSGITIHYVNNEYDKGNIILQARCEVSENDTADNLAKKIHQLEHYYFPRVIEYLLTN